MEENNNLNTNPSDVPKKIEVVTGNSDNLSISPVYEHLEVEKPKQKENKTIIIPEVKNTINTKQEEKSDENDTSDDDEVSFAVEPDDKE